MTKIDEEKNIDDVEEVDEVEETDETEEETEETEEAVKEDLKGFIKNETEKASIEAWDKKLNALSQTLVDKFYTNVASQRKAAIDGNQPKRKLSQEEQVKKWFLALRSRDVSTLRGMEKDYISVGDDDSAGYLIPPSLLAEVNRFTEEYGVARRNMRYLPFSGPGNERQIPALVNSVSVGWVDEAGAKPSTRPTFKLVTQSLKKLAAIVPMTEEILEDSAINLISLLGELIGTAIAQAEDTAFFTGSVADSDPFDGVLNADGIVTLALSEDANAVDALNHMLYLLPSEIRNKGTYYMHPSFFGAFQRVKNDVGDYIVQQPTGGRPATIWNRPVELVNVLPSVSDVEDGIEDGTPIMFYTDLSRTCVYGDKGGMRTKLLDEATIKSAEESPSDLNLALQDMVALRVVKRVGFVPVLPQGIGVFVAGEESPSS